MKILKEEKGSITLFVLLAMLFFVMFLVGMYMLSANSESSQTAETARIKEIYEQDVDNIDDVYETLVGEKRTKVNAPKLAGGMTPIKWNGTNTVDTNSSDKEWYNYVDTSIQGQTSTSKWANARTKDGSMWVWIPRYAYKITYANASDKSAGGTIDVVFLQGTSNKDFNGNDVTSSTYVDEKGSTGAYIVHPAFTDESSNGYANGGWDSELTGFWVAKFEAGYEGTVGDKSSATDSNVALSVIFQWNGTTGVDLTTNYYGTRAIGDKIKYPVFKANCPSMNNLGISDAYDLCLDIKNGTSVYGLSNVDSHMLKNSEWGAVAYLTHSKYGRNGQEVTINNVSANNTNTIHAVTGYGASSTNASTDTSRTLATLLTENQAGSWTTTQGQTASSTGNIYGIYDLSGGTWEWTAGYIASGDSYTSYGGSLKGDSTKYKTKYVGTSDTDTINYNMNLNPTRLGEAIWETSSGGTGFKSWNGDYSNFWINTRSFSVRSGAWSNTSGAGVFTFLSGNGFCVHDVGFRPVLVAE